MVAHYKSAVRIFKFKILDPKYGGPKYEITWEGLNLVVGVFRVADYESELNI